MGICDTSSLEGPGQQLLTVLLSMAFNYLPLSRSRDLTDIEAVLIEKLKEVDELEHIVGEYAEKSAYLFLKECIMDDEVLVINNLRIMAMKDLDDIAEDFEKDFIILNLTRRQASHLLGDILHTDAFFRSQTINRHHCSLHF